MKKTFIFLVGMILMSCPAFAALQHQAVEYSQDGVVMEGYVVYDDALTGKRPGVLVVHEWKGLNDYAKHRADMLAELGYVAFAADIYGKGVRPQTNEEAGAEAGKYKKDRILLRSRVNAALTALKGNALVDDKQIAAIGYCFGGMTVLELARSGAEVKGIVSFHGNLNTPDPKDAKNIKTKLLVLHGAADPFVPAAEVEAFKKEMADAGVYYQFVAYPGAMHAFTNPDNKGEIPGALYNAEADKQSWQAMKDFFADLFK